MKYDWDREQYAVCCTGNERRGLVSFEIGIWNLRGIKNGSEKGRKPEYVLRTL
jgi:hypothetical protein